MPVPVSTEQRKAIISLLSEGLENKQIAAQVGVTPGQVAAVKAHVTMRTYGGGESNDTAEEAEIATAVDTAFGLERDLQMALRRNIDQLQPGLTVADGDKEQIVASGRIDIKARDQHGRIVVIELKAGEPDRDSIGQILAYMGVLMNQDDETHVRGILVAKEFTPRTVSAARAAANIRLVQYRFRFTFETVAESPA